jgi:hypothetical protein
MVVDSHPHFSTAWENNIKNNVTKLNIIAAPDFYWLRTGSNFWFFVSMVNNPLVA